MDNTNNLPQNLVDGTTIEYSKGHLSAKLRIKNIDGTETWTDYDTRSATADLQSNESILVFNSELGVYEEVSTLEEAKIKFEHHYSRLKVTVKIKALAEEDIARQQRLIKLLQDRKLLSQTPLIDT